MKLFSSMNSTANLILANNKPKGIGFTLDTKSDIMTSLGKELKSIINVTKVYKLMMGGQIYFDRTDTIDDSIIKSKCLDTVKASSANYPKGVFLIADKQFPQIVNGTHFTLDPETNNIDPDMVKKLEQLKPISSLKFPGEGDDSVYLKKGIHHASDGYIYRLK